MLETLQKTEPTDEVRMDGTGRQSAGNDQLNWLAGLVDGEGSIMVAKRKGKYGDTFRPIITIANTHKPTIERACAILKENGVGPYFCTNRDKRGKYPPQYSAFVNGFKRCQKFLSFMRERLFTKRMQAELLNEYISLRECGSPGIKYTQRELDIAEQIKKLNNSRYWYSSSETLRATPDMRPLHSGGWNRREDKVQSLAIN